MRLALVAAKAEDNLLRKDEVVREAFPGKGEGPGRVESEEGAPPFEG